MDLLDLLKGNSRCVPLFIGSPSAGKDAGESGDGQINVLRGGIAPEPSTSERDSFFKRYERGSTWDHFFIIVEILYKSPMARMPVSKSFPVFPI